MNSDNKPLFIFGFIFYFIGDLATTYVALNNGFTEKGFIRVIGSPGLADMVIVKIIFFTALYFLIMFLEKRGNNYLCGAILGLVAGMGMTVTWMNALVIMEYLKYQLINMTFIDTFNNRERAIAIWLFVFLAWAFTKKDFRKSILNVFKLLFLTKFAFVLLGAIVYVALIIMLLYKAKLWDFLLVKDTIIWTLGTGFVLLLKSNKALQDNNHFRKIVFDILTLTVVLEFITNFYTFDLWVEIFLFPVLLFIVTINAYAGLNEKFKKVKNLTNLILAIYGIYILLFAFSQVISNYHSLVTLYNLQTLVLPLFLTVVYIPCLYVIALITAYDKLFSRLEFLIRKDKALVKYTKFKIITLCHLNLNKLNKFVQENNSNFQELASKKDVMKIIEQFRTKRE